MHKFKQFVSYLRIRFQDPKINLSIINGEIIGVVGFKQSFFSLRRFAGKNNFQLDVQILENIDFSCGKSQKIINIYLFPQNSLTLINGKNNLNSQLLPNDKFRIFHRSLKDDFLFVESEDFTEGWVKNEDLKIVNQLECTENGGWRSRILSKGEKIDVQDISSIKDSFENFREEWVDVPYLLGGKTKNGVDCSGLSQQLFFYLFGKVLPRNSLKQSEVGKLSSFSNLNPLDIVYCRSKIGGYGHILIYDFDGNFFQSSRRISQVCTSSREDILEHCKIVRPVSIIKQSKSLYLKNLALPSKNTR